MGMPTRHRRVFLPISDAGRFPARWERILAEVPIFTTFMYTSKFSFAFVCPNSVPTPATAWPLDECDAEIKKWLLGIKVEALQLH